MKKHPIDLSVLTLEEIKMFDDSPEVLTSGDTDVALYMRYSSDRQTEQSIEGQLRDAITFCKMRKYRIVAIYVDRATSATKDIKKRVHFLNMIADSDKRKWEYVVVWKLDRFARSRNDSAIYKMRLRKNGVKVVSVTENISNDPEGIILEAVLEGMAEFYSAELSQKITRGMRESALKCHSVGGHVPLGYKIENHKLVIDPLTAPIVQKAFNLYAQGWSVADICEDFNNRGYRTAKNSKFNKNSFKSMFKNKRYVGIYTYKDEIVIEGGVPAIVDKKLFKTVNDRLKQTSQKPGKNKAKVDYLLSGKLFCGHCSQPMTAGAGTGKLGQVYHYYQCRGRKTRSGCDKKPLKKEAIETWVAKAAMEILTDDLISEIADMAVAQSDLEIQKTTKLPLLTDKYIQVETAINNIVAVIEKGVASDTLMNRIAELEKDKKDIQRQIDEEKKYVFMLDRDQVIYWLSQFKNGDIHDENFKRQLIDLLVNSVTVWDLPDGDYKVTVAYNLTSCESRTFRVSDNPKEGSYLRSQAPPLDANTNTLYVVGSVCVQTKRCSLP